MSLLTRDLADLIANAGLGTVGTDIYVELLPASPDNALMLLSLVSAPPDPDIDTRYQDFEIWSRNISTKDAAQKLEDIYQLINRMHHITLGSKYVYFISAQGNIDNMDVDAEGRKLFRLHLQAIYRDTNTVS